MNFDPYNIFLSIMFGFVGFGAWRYGRSMQSARHMVLAIVLMTFSYFTPNLYVTLGVGAALSVLLFWP